MRRTKEWWAALTRGERIFLVYAEKNQRGFYGSPYLPDGTIECGVCGYPGYSGWCSPCFDRVIKIIELADIAVTNKGMCDTCDGKTRIIKSFVRTVEKSIKEIGCEDWAGVIEEWAEPCPDCCPKDYRHWKAGEVYRRQYGSVY